MDFITTIEEMTTLYVENRPLYLYKAQQVIDLIEYRLKILANLQRTGVYFHNTKISQAAEWKSVFFKNFTTFLGTQKNQEN